MSRITGTLARVYDWLACADTPEPCDVIFVLAGREYRKAFGLRLLQERGAGRLILSVGRYEIRRFSKLQLPVAIDLIAASAMTPPDERHYFVTFRDGNAEVQIVKLYMLGTMSEIRAFARWLDANPGIRSAMVVSSAFHLRRIRLCCRKFVKRDVNLLFVGAPGPELWDRDTWWHRPHSLKMVASEIPKLLVYSLWWSRRATRSQSGAADYRLVHS